MLLRGTQDPLPDGVWKLIGSLAMLEQVILRDFKGHRDSIVGLSPLTLLVGPNGAGKTSALEAIRFLGQLHYKSFDDVFRGPSSPDDLMRHSDGVHGFHLGVAGVANGARRGLTL